MQTQRRFVVSFHFRTISYANATSSNPVSGTNTPYLQIGFALPFLLFHAKFLTFADKTVDFLGSTIPVPTFYLTHFQELHTLPGLPEKFEIGL